MARVAALGLAAAVVLGSAAAQQTLVEVSGLGDVTTLCQNALLNGGFNAALYCNSISSPSGVVLGALCSGK